MVNFRANLWILTPDEYSRLPNGTELISINGDIATKGVDYIDQDTRYGHIAWGFVGPLEDHPLSELLTVFRLS